MVKDVLSRTAGRSKGLFILIILAVILLGAWGIYQYANRKAFVDHGPLAPPPSGQVQFAGSVPKNGFHLEEGNILSRSVFQTSRPNAQIEVRDVMLPPNKHSRLATLSGPALVEVYSGAGTMVVGEKSEPLSAGDVKVVSAGQVPEFENQNSFAMVLRIYRVEAK